uniref:Uncharacterized protein n=1 Tax=Rhizophora mucronata TaxID=61149 RepID=A0A2P2NTM5_RHIMU
MSKNQSLRRDEWPFNNLKNKRMHDQCSQGHF